MVMKNWTGLFHCTFPSSSGGGLTSMVTVGTVDASFRRFVAAVRLFGFKFLRNSNILKLKKKLSSARSQCLSFIMTTTESVVSGLNARMRRALRTSARVKAASRGVGATIKEYQCKLYELYRIHMGLVVHISTFDTFECIRCYFLGFIDFLAHLMYLDD